MTLSVDNGHIDFHSCAFFRLTVFFSCVCINFFFCLLLYDVIVDRHCIQCKICLKYARIWKIWLRNDSGCDWKVCVCVCFRCTLTTANISSAYIFVLILVLPKMRMSLYLFSSLPLTTSS